MPKLKLENEKLRIIMVLVVIAMAIGLTIGLSIVIKKLQQSRNNARQADIYNLQSALSDHVYSAKTNNQVNPLPNRQELIQIISNLDWQFYDKQKIKADLEALNLNKVQANQFYYASLPIFSKATITPDSSRFHIFLNAECKYSIFHDFEVNQAYSEADIVITGQNYSFAIVYTTESETNYYDGSVNDQTTCTQTDPDIIYTYRQQFLEDITTIKTYFIDYLNEYYELPPLDEVNQYILSAEFNPSDSIDTHQEKTSFRNILRSHASAYVTLSSSLFDNEGRFSTPSLPDDYVVHIISGAKCNPIPPDNSDELVYVVRQDYQTTLLQLGKHTNFVIIYSDFDGYVCEDNSGLEPNDLSGSNIEDGEFYGSLVFSKYVAVALPVDWSMLTAKQKQILNPYGCWDLDEIDSETGRCLDGNYELYGAEGTPDWLTIDYTTWIGEDSLVEINPYDCYALTKINLSNGRCLAGGGRIWDGSPSDIAPKADIDNDSLRSQQS